MSEENVQLSATERALSKAGYIVGGEAQQGAQQGEENTAGSGGSGTADTSNAGGANNGDAQNNAGQNNPGNTGNAGTGTNSGAAATQLPDEPTLLKGIFGDEKTPFKSVKEVREAIARIPVLETERGTLAAQVDEYKPRSSYSEGLIKAEKAGISRENFDMIQQIDALKDKEIACLVLNKQIQSKGTLSAADAEFLVREEYKLDEAYDPEKPELAGPGVKAARIRLKADAVSAFDTLSAHKLKLGESPLELRARELKTAWEPLMPALTGIKEIEIPTAEGVFKFPVTDDMRTDTANFLTKLINQPEFNLMPSGKGADEMRTMLQDRIIASNMTKILDAVRDEMYVKYTIEKHNPKSLINQAGEPAGAQAGNANKAMYDEMLKDRGRSPRVEQI